MVASSADEAVANARKTTKNNVGMCLWYAQEWLETPHAYPDATTQWKNCKHKHSGDKNPPRGAPVFWTGGSHGYGHAAISVGNGKIRSIDQQYSGVTSEVPINEIQSDWGLPYGGWSEDCGGVDIPWLRDGGKPTPPPEPKGILGMSELNRQHTGKDKVIKPNDDWWVIPINDKGDSSFLTGAATFDAEVFLQFTGLTPGVNDQARVRFGRYDPNKDSADYYQQVEVPGSGGTTFFHTSLINWIPDKLKLRVYVQTSVQVTVTDVQANVLYEND